MNIPRHFTYFLFENFDPAQESNNTWNPRNFMNASADEILTWVAEASKQYRTYRIACERFSKDAINKLINGGALRVENDVLFFDTPIFFDEDTDSIASFFSNAASAFTRMIFQREKELYIEAEALKNGFLPQINLYHIICGMCFDGYFLDKLSETGALANERMHPSGLDYLSVIYEKSAKLDHFSNALLCSYNRVFNDVCALQSFGDGDGNRLDCYRYFRMREKNALTDSFAEIHKVTANLTEYDLLSAMRNILLGSAVAPELIISLEIFGYLKSGRVCVPVFEKKHSNTIQRIESILEDVLLQPISEWLSNLNSLKIIAMAHGVHQKEIANECWHILFGSINEMLVQSGFVTAPLYHKGEGRYLQSVEIYV